MGARIKLGVGVSTQNRREVALESLSKIKWFSPNAKIVIVDDYSNEPFPNADFRFNEIAGVAKAKNKCLELLEDCDYIFLFDDDCHPVMFGWEQYYIDAFLATQCHQMQFIFDKFRSGQKTTNQIVKDYGLLIEYSNPAGCMIFLTNHCLKTIGGFDTNFGRYGYEHTEYSRRAFNAGLTIAPFVDISNSKELFYSYDYEQKINSVISNTNEKMRYFNMNKSVYSLRINDKHFKPYK